MNSSLKHWSAIAINTKALATHREADGSALAVEEPAARFSESVAAIALRSTALNCKRNEREQVISQLEAGEIAPETTAELGATLAAIDLKLVTVLAAFSTSESNALNLRAAVEHVAPLAHQQRFMSISPREADAKVRE